MAEVNLKNESHRKVAQMLARRNGADVNDMAEALEISTRAVRNLIDRLKGKGLKIQNLERGSGRFQLIQPKAASKRRRGRTAPSTA